MSAYRNSDDIRDYKYIAYISCSNNETDRKAAALIQKRIESYVIPEDFRNSRGEKRLGKVFQNDNENPLSSDFSNSINQVLDESKYLIVICSPEYAKSRWCKAELDHFLQTHESDHVFVVLIDSIYVDCYPQQLLYQYDENGNIIGSVEPLAANLSAGDHNVKPKTVHWEILRILAPMLGRSYSELLQVERQRSNPLAFLKKSASKSDKKNRTESAGIRSASVLSFSYSRPNQTIRFFQEDLTDTDQSYDVVVCSAYKGMYDAALFSLIGSLETKKKISVKKLAEDPELDLRELGGWLSRPINKQFRRLLCVEMTAFLSSFAEEKETGFASILKSAFLTLRHLLERASLQGMDIRRIALPILGAGYQQIDIEYIAPPLFTQCVNMFKTIPSLETIDFYEIDPEKHMKMVSICNELASMSTEKTPDLFISYASAQTEYAHRLQSGLQENGIAAWIAPESIPTGSNYIAEIPKAISSVRAILLLLTEEAQNSRWVQKEVGSAIGAGKLLLPMIIHSFSLTSEMTFLLEGEQFYPVWQETPEQQIPAIIREVQKRLQT